MKRFCIFLLVVGLSISAFAQYDDIYDGGTYKSKKETKEVSSTTTSRSIDEYNRVGTTDNSSLEASDLDLGEDYQYTKEIVKYYDPTAVTIENPEYVYIYNNTEEEKANSSANIYVNLGWTNWYSPWYYDSWFTWNPWGSVWYDPWYDPFWVHPYSPYPGYYPYTPYRPYPYQPYPYYPYHPPHHPHHPAPDHHHHHGPVDAHSRDYNHSGNSRGNATRPSTNTRNTNNVSRPSNTKRNTDGNVSRPSSSNRTNITNTQAATRRGSSNSSTSTGTVNKRSTSNSNNSFTPSRSSGNTRSSGTVSRGGGNSRSGGAAPRGARR